MTPIVILGSGLAGYSVARELRRRDKAVPLVLVTADDGEYYSKPALSNALVNGQTCDQLVLYTAEQMARSLRAEVLTRRSAAAIDRAHRRVEWLGGDVEYAKLVLAVGARCHRPAIAGDAAQDLLSVNCLDDYARLRKQLAGARRVVILGAGLVGCEFANDLAATGHAVHVVEMASQALPRLLAHEPAVVLAERLASIGVRFTFGARATRMDRAPGGFRVELDNGATQEADLVLAATGLLPSTALARDAGLATRSGIVVDRYLRTNDRDIYAIGDCAEHEGRVLPFTEPIRHGARALGATLAGTETALEFPRMRVELKTPAYPLSIEAPLKVLA